MYRSRLFLIVFVILVLFQSIYGGGRVYTETNGVDWSYEVWKTDSTYLNIDTSGVLYSSGGPFSPTGVSSYPNLTAGNYGLLFRYPSSTEDFVFAKAPVDLSIHGTDPNTPFSFQKYSHGIPSNADELDDPYMHAEINSFNPTTGEVQITSNLLPPQTTSGNQITGLDIVNPTLLEKYYYMKTLVFLVAQHQGSGEDFIFYPNEIEAGTYQLRLDNFGGPGTDNYERAINRLESGIKLNTFKFYHTDYANYVLLKPASNMFNFNLTLIEDELINKCTNGSAPCGIYEVQIRSAPIDLKGDNKPSFGWIDYDYDGLQGGDAVTDYYNSPVDLIINSYCDVEISDVKIINTNIFEYKLTSPTTISNVPIKLEFNRSFLIPQDSNLSATNTTSIILSRNGESSPGGELNYPNFFTIPFPINPPEIKLAYAGNYSIRAYIDPSDLTGCTPAQKANSKDVTADPKDFGLMFCNIGNDGDCDSVPNNFDQETGVYGSPYYMGSKSEYIPILGLSTVVYEKKLNNFLQYSSFLAFDRNITYDALNDEIICSTSPWATAKNYFKRDGIEIGTRQHTQVKISNPQPGKYECFYETNNLAASADLNQTSTVISGRSVYDVDVDGLNYYNTWWRTAFSSIESSYRDDDLCPVTFGFPENKGCPVTNEESIKRNETPSSEIIETDENNFVKKFEFNTNTSEIFLDGSLYSLTLPNVTAQVNVDVSSSCIPTSRISKIINNDVFNISLAAISKAALRSSNPKVQLLEQERVSKLSASDKLALIDRFRKGEDCLVPISRTDNLSKVSLLSQLHLLKPIDETPQSKSIVESVIETTNQLIINKSITPSVSPSEVKTTININIDNIPADTTIWQIIPKESAANFSKLLSTVTKGNADQIRIKDKDPIIGWYFGSGGSSGNLEFEIDGLGEGGSTIAMNDTIYFNLGELIVNYREFGCFSGENELFTTRNISGSDISQTGLRYSVCIAHNESDVINSSVSYTESYFSVDGGANIFIPNTSANNVNLYKDHPTNKWYAQSIGELPPINGFSCIGSYDDSGKFGGCMYDIDNRIWLYYGIDDENPTIELNYFASHTIAPSIRVNDFISGIDFANSYYCVTPAGGDSCTPNTPVPSNEFSITLSCPDIRECERFINISVQDGAGNSAQHEEMLILLQEATSCASSCIAEPLPGRYLASCRGINSCEFYGLDSESDEDKGKTVANLCNYKIKGSWVELGASGIEVQCPNGPARLSRFTNTDFEISSNSTICDDMRVDRRAVILDGEEIMMNIIVCD